MGLPHAPARHSADHRSGPRRGARLGIVTLGALTLVLPLPDAALVAWRRAYEILQPQLTTVAAWLPVPVLDLAVAGAVVWLAFAFLAWRRRRRRANAAAGQGAVDVLLRIGAFASAVWLVFLMLWGWHYQVPTLETRLDVRPDELSPERGHAFAQAVVASLNQLHDAAHARPWPTRAEVAQVMGPRVAAVLPELGQSWQPAWPAPRRTLIDLYFRTAGIDGMTNPFGLEVVLNSRVLPMELPALAGHEFAHLAGFADESDASVVAWLACQTGDAALKYSGALAVLPHVVTGMPAPMRRQVLQGLGPGPRKDLEAISARLAEQQPWVHAMAWQTYDRFLKANRVGEGVARYDAVARVLVGVADPTTGRLRRWPSAWPPVRR